MGSTPMIIIEDVVECLLINQLIGKEKNKINNNSVSSSPSLMWIKDYCYMLLFCETHNVIFMFLILGQWASDHGWANGGGVLHTLCE